MTSTTESIEDLEEHLRQVLNAVAESTARLADLDEIIPSDHDLEVDAMRWASTASAPRARSLTFGLLVSASIVVAGLVVIALRSGPEERPSSGFIPAGSPFLLSDNGTVLSSDVPAFVSVPALTRRIGVPGHPELEVTTVLEYLGHDTAYIHRCVSGACAPEWNRSPIQWAVSSTVDNGVGDFDIWTWTNVPESAAFVTYTGPAGVSWQRPVFGVAAFPDAGDGRVVTAYATDGSILSRFTIGNEPGTDETIVPPLADLTDTEISELQELTYQLTHDCLTRAGGQPDGATIVAFDSKAADVAEWNQCAAATKQAIATRVDELTDIQG